MTKDNNPMRRIRLSKVTVNIATGKSGEPLEKAKKVLAEITGQQPATRRAKRTVKEFGIRQGEPIASVVTLRGERAVNFLKRALEAVNNRLPTTAFDLHGNISFGIKEHIEIPGAKYRPELGIFGATVSATLDRPGYRVKYRSYRDSRVGKSHQITREEAMDFIRQNLQAQIGTETSEGG